MEPPQLPGRLGAASPPPQPAAQNRPFNMAEDAQLAMFRVPEKTSKSASQWPNVVHRGVADSRDVTDTFQVGGGAANGGHPPARSVLYPGSITSLRKCCVTPIR